MAPWHLVEAESDPNKAWDIWKQIFTCIADSNASLKKKRVRGTSAPWITPELKHDMFERDRLKKVASRSRSGAGAGMGVQGWRSGESTRLPPMWPGSDSLTRRHMWVEFVGSLLCTERFSPGTPVSPLLKNQSLT